MCSSLEKWTVKRMNELNRAKKNEKKSTEMKRNHVDQITPFSL